MRSALSTHLILLAPVVPIKIDAATTLAARATRAGADRSDGHGGSGRTRRLIAIGEISLIFCEAPRAGAPTRGTAMLRANFGRACGSNKALEHDGEFAWRQYGAGRGGKGADFNLTAE